MPPPRVLSSLGNPIHLHRCIQPSLRELLAQVGRAQSHQLALQQSLTPLPGSGRVPPQDAWAQQADGGDGAGAEHPSEDHPLTRTKRPGHAHTMGQGEHTPRQRPTGRSPAATGTPQHRPHKHTQDTQPQGGYCRYKRRAHTATFGKSWAGKTNKKLRSTSPSNQGTNTSSRAGLRRRGMQRRREDACIY